MSQVSSFTTKNSSCEDFLTDTHTSTHTTVCTSISSRECNEDEHLRSLLRIKFLVMFLTLFGGAFLAISINFWSPVHPYGANSNSSPDAELGENSGVERVGLIRNNDTGLCMEIQDEITLVECDPNKPVQKFTLAQNTGEIKLENKCFFNKQVIKKVNGKEVMGIHVGTKPCSENDPPENIDRWKFDDKTGQISSKSRTVTCLRADKTSAVSVDNCDPDKSKSWTFLSDKI